MNLLFDYGLFITSQNLSCRQAHDGFGPEVGEPWPCQNHSPSAFWMSSRDTGDSNIENHCVYFADLSVEKERRDARGEEFYNDYKRSLSHRCAQFKHRMRQNMVDDRRWRFDTYTHIDKETLRGWGEQVAQILEGNLDEREIIELLEDMRDRAPKLANRVLAMLQDNDHADFVAQCSDCGAYCDREESHDTHDGDLICEDCRDNEYTYSECMDGYIFSEHTCAVYNTHRAYERGSADDYCTERYGERNFYGYDGAYFVDECEVPGYYDRDDEDDCNSSELPGYHSQYREFRERNVTPDKAALGVELEVYNEDRMDCVGSLHDNFADLICERDGSLDDDCGFEIVTQPYGPTEWAALAPGLLKHLRDGGTRGYQTPDAYKYGIHINVHRRHFSPLAEARIMLMLCDVKNQDFVRAVAQREGIYNSDLEMGSRKAPKVRMVSRDGCGLQTSYCGGRAQRKIYTAGKFAPINWQENIAEFRIFNSTLNEVSFMKNLEFVWALIAWTKPTAATGSSTDHKDFIKWLASPQQRTQYPNLINYLSRKAFFTKGGSRIDNTWLSLLNKPSDVDTSELLLAA